MGSENSQLCSNNFASAMIRRTDKKGAWAAPFVTSNQQLITGN